MVHLEDRQTLDSWSPAAERVETRAEHDDLSRALGNRVARDLLADPAAQGDKQAHRPQGRIHVLLEEHGEVRAEQVRRERVGQDLPTFRDLMGGAQSGRGQCGETELALDHEESPLPSHRPADGRPEVRPY